MRVGKQVYGVYQVGVIGAPSGGSLAVMGGQSREKQPKDPRETAVLPGAPAGVTCGVMPEGAHPA